MRSLPRCPRPCRLFLLACVSAWLFANGSLAYAFESPDYEVLEKDGKFEVRLYEAFLIAQITVNGAAEEAGDAAFPALAGYISGENQGEEKISMTTPVSQSVSDNTQVVSFMMPKQWQLETLPQPDNEAVVLREVPSRLIASLRYNGNWTETRFRKFEQRLRTILVDLPYTICSEPLWARYNPPFWPTLLRRNEVQFIVSKTGCSDVLGSSQVIDGHGSGYFFF